MIKKPGKLKDHIDSLLATNEFQVVVFQDYDKGLLSASLINDVISNCRSANIPVTVDPKRDHFFDYRQATLFKPNLSELKLSLNKTFDPDDLGELEAAIIQLREKSSS